MLIDKKAHLAEARALGLQLDPELPLEDIKRRIDDVQAARHFAIVVLRHNLKADWRRYADCPIAIEAFNSVSQAIAADPTLIPTIRLKASRLMRDGPLEDFPILPGSKTYEAVRQLLAKHMAEQIAPLRPAKGCAGRAAAIVLWGVFLTGLACRWLSA